MRFKVILGVILLVGVGIGRYIYKNKYSFFKYLPAVSNEQVKKFNGKIYDENEKLFSGRIKESGGEYTDIYSYKDGELDGLNVIYYKNNIKEIGYWKEGKQNGLFQMYTESGVLVDSGTFKNGERDGLTEQFYSETGKMRVSANYKNGVLEGEFKEYYENKNIRLVGSYKESLQDGEWKFYLEKGNLQSIVNYKDGELNGLKEDYYENGNLWTRQEFKNNIQDGVYELYYENGTPQLKAVIKNSQRTEEQRFNFDGITISESDEEITIKEVSDDKVIISENSEDFSKEFEKGMEKLGKEVGSFFSLMLEATYCN